MSMDTDEAPRALGAVVEEGRGGLPFHLIHGESLVACAAWALGEAGVTVVDLRTQWEGIVGSGEPLVLHDALCPMTPAPFIAECVARCVETGMVVVGTGDAATSLSPVVIPGPFVAALDGLPSLDFPELVGRLEELCTVERMPAPATAARVATPAELIALEVLTTPEPA